MYKYITKPEDILLKGNTLGFDLETDGLNIRKNKVLLIQLSDGVTTYILDNRILPKEYIISIFNRYKNCTFIAHNAKFDIGMLYSNTGYLLENIFDTMIAEAVLYPGKGTLLKSLKGIIAERFNLELDKSLQTSFLTPTREFTQEQLEYAAQDVTFLNKIYSLQNKEIVDGGFSNVMQLENNLTPVIMKMEYTGVRLEPHKLFPVIEREEQKSKEYEAQLFEIAGREFNPRSPKQVKELFHELGRKTNNKNLFIDSTSEDVLKFIKHPLAKTLLAYRSSAKIVSTYGIKLIEHIQDDGKVHCDFNQTGTETGRLSCVPLEAEALTKSGWKLPNDLHVGDEILGFDILERKYTWTTIKNLSFGRAQVGLIKTSKNHDNRYTKGFYCTGNHRWIVETEDVIGFSNAERIPRKYDLLIQPKAIFPEPEKSILSNIEAFIFGWFLTDGYRIVTSSGRSALEIMLVKTRSINLLREYLDKYKIEYSTSRYKMSDGHYKTRFYLGVNIFTDIYERATSVSPSELVLNLDSPARTDMLLAMLEADGSMHRHSHNYTSFGAEKNYWKNTAEYFEVLAVATGTPYTYRYLTLASGKQFVVFYLLEKELYAYRNSKWNPEYETDVWCPETTCGTWVMRQGDNICITGNSSHFNLQNIPAATEFRTPFIASEGYKFFTADFSQIELRLAGIVSGEPEILNEYKKEVPDLHRVTAAKMFNIDPEFVTKEQRSHGKIGNFSCLYGSSATGLSTKQDIPLDLAEKIVESFWKGYPVLNAYKNKVGKETLQNGFSRTRLGRIRYFQHPDSRDPAYRYKISAIQREGFNMVIQGFAADIMKYALVLVDKALGDAGRLVLTVHDEVGVELVEDQSVEKSKLVLDTMEKAGTILVNGVIPMQVEGNLGDCWSK